MKNLKSLLLTIVAAAFLLGSAGFAFAQGQQTTAAPDQPGSTSPQAAQPGMMGGKGMMGGGMMGGCGGMGMMNTDPKMRGQMMQIKGRMMKEMGDLMIKRGKELEEGK